MEDVQEIKKYYCEKCNFKCKFKAHLEKYEKTSKHINGKIIKKKYETKKKEKHINVKNVITKRHIYIIIKDIY